MNTYRGKTRLLSIQNLTPVKCCFSKQPCNNCNNCNNCNISNIVMSMLQFG